MMIYFGEYNHARQIADAAGSGYDVMRDCVISITNDDKLLGGVIYTNYTGRTVQMHQAGFALRWATPQFMYRIYEFPFSIMKVERVLATVPSTNERALIITMKMGFIHVSTIPDVVPGGHMVVLSMSRDACKYLKLGWRYAVLENAA